MALCDLPFHHIGIATRGIDKELSVVRRLGYRQSSEIFVDERQGIRGVFVEADGQPRLELLENLREDGPLTSCLAKGIKLYHLAYESKDIETDVQSIGGHPICPIVSASYFEKVCFLAMPNAMIVELVQKKMS